MNEAPTTAHIEFFFDPMCPWAWITSRFVNEVATHQPLDVTWRFISLRMVNEAKDYERDFPPAYERLHAAGTAMLRVAAAVGDSGGSAAVGRLYTELGTRLHDQGGSARIRDGEDPSGLLGEAVVAAGLPAALASAAADEAWTEVVRADTSVALARTGPGVGTPIITFDPSRPDNTSIFGPVVARIPRGHEAVAVWEAARLLACTPGLAELKRSRRDRPDFT